MDVDITDFAGLGFMAYGSSESVFMPSLCTCARRGQAIRSCFQTVPALFSSRFEAFAPKPEPKPLNPKPLNPKP